MKISPLKILMYTIATGAVSYAFPELSFEQLTGLLLAVILISFTVNLK